MIHLKPKREMRALAVRVGDNWAMSRGVVVDGVDILVALIIVLPERGITIGGRHEFVHLSPPTIVADSDQGIKNWIALIVDGIDLSPDPETSLKKIFDIGVGGEFKTIDPIWLFRVAEIAALRADDAEISHHEFDIWLVVDSLQNVGRVQGYVPLMFQISR